MCYIGSDELVPCIHSDYCRDGTWLIPQENVTIVEDSPETLDNWVGELDLMCRSNLLIGLFGSLFFVGFVLGAVFVTPLGDRYGRVTAILVGHAINNTGFMFIAFVHNLVFRNIGVFLAGVADSPRTANSYILMLESVPEKYRPWVGSALQMNEALIMIWASGFFYFISKNW